MVEETIERDGKQWKIAYGFGRLQKARQLYASNLPDSIKRALIANPNLTEEELIAKVDRADLFKRADVDREIVALVLESAPGWNRGNVLNGSIMEYVDSQLPEDVGEEIVLRMAKALQREIFDPSSKKN